MDSVIYDQMELDGYSSHLEKLYAKAPTTENLLRIKECEAKIDTYNTYIDEQIVRTLEQTTARLESELKGAIELIEKKQEKLNIATRDLALYHDCLRENRQLNMALEWSSSPTALEHIAELEAVEKVATKEHYRAKSDAVYILLKKNAHTAHCNFHTMAKLLGISRQSIADMRARAWKHPAPSAYDFQVLTIYWNSATDQLVERFYRGF